MSRLRNAVEDAVAAVTDLKVVETDNCLFWEWPLDQADDPLDPPLSFEDFEDRFAEILTETNRSWVNLILADIYGERLQFVIEYFVGDGAARSDPASISINISGPSPDGTHRYLVEQRTASDVAVLLQNLLRSIGTGETADEMESSKDMNTGDGVVSDREVLEEDLEGLQRLVVYQGTFAAEVAETATQRPELWWLEFQAGRHRDLSILERFPRLRFLALNSIRTLDDLSPIAGLSELEFLWIRALPKVTDGPSLAGLTRLRRVDVRTMKRLTGLRWALDAPNLEELFVENFRANEEDMQAIEDHPSLSRLTWIGGKAGPNIRGGPFAERIDHMEKTPSVFKHDWFGVPKI